MDGKGEGEGGSCGIVRDCYGIRERGWRERFPVSRIRVVLFYAMKTSVNVTKVHCEPDIYKSASCAGVFELQIL